LPLLFLWLASAVFADEPPPAVVPPTGTAETFRLFADVLDGIQKNYLDADRVNINQIGPAAFRELVRQIDPDADLLSPEEYATLKDAPAIPEVTLAVRNGKVVVVAPRDGSAAQQAGVLARDEVVCHNNSLTIARAIVQTRSTLLVRGVIGNAVKAIAIGEPVYKPATLKLLNDHVVYLRLSEFSGPALTNLEDQLAAAGQHSMRGLILDLRNNPGGSIDAAVHLARLFLPAKATIVTIDYAHTDHRARFVVDETGRFPRKLPIVVLVNHGTAGEAEVFAAALSDNGQAMLVGSRTFGNGRVIANFPIHDGYALSLPSARYITPSSQIFYPDGLAPDDLVDVAPADERPLAAKGYGNFDWATDSQEILKTDRPLARALELLTKSAKK
jgi:carboxyl-terminal processing protease